MAAGEGGSKALSEGTMLFDRAWAAAAEREAMEAGSDAEEQMRSRERRVLGEERQKVSSQFSINIESVILVHLLLEFKSTDQPG